MKRECCKWPGRCLTVNPENCANKRHLIIDRDTKYSVNFRHILEREGVWRSASVNRIRRRPSLARNARFSAFKYLISAAACRSSQQAMLAISNARKFRGIQGIDLSYNAPRQLPIEFSNRTSSILRPLTRFIFPIAMPSPMAPAKPAPFSSPAQWRRNSSKTTLPSARSRRVHCHL